MLLNFWATWCLPCQEESPVLSKLAQAYPQQLQVLAVAVQDDHKKLEAFAARVKPAYTILESGDLKSTLALSYGVNNGMGSATVPYSVLVRPDGTIAYVQGGYEAPSPLEKQISDFITRSDQRSDCSKPGQARIFRRRSDALIPYPDYAQSELRGHFPPTGDAMRARWLSAGFDLR